jgi:4-hydroxy-tetrahydrodipicolinate reductase
MMGSGEKLAVMVNGVPGRMAAATAEEVVARGLVLADEALTGPGVENATVQIGSHSVTLAAPPQHAACLQRVRDKYPRIIVVDYTHPSACNPNVELYAAAGLSFVVGTTGGDVEAMQSVVRRTPGVYAVVAPNMGKQIVAFQAMMDMMAREFPGAFDGYSMTVTESHQSTKADTSGTAKAVVKSFQQLGIDFHVGEIQKVRTPPESMEKMKVPGKFVTTGHAFHTYRLTSPDGTVNFEFQHNVCGRGVYAAGTVDAVQFVDSRRQDGSEQRIFDMIDILRSGSMR